MQCSSCQHENLPDSVFCESCGTKLSPSCPSCGADASPEARFCRRCGASIQPTAARPPPNTPATRSEAERRQLTVLFCDLVDSTELASGLDAEDWREIVRRFQRTCARVIERFEGHIAQYLGDGLLVYFGYPKAHEDDAERAVRAGLGVMDALGERGRELDPQHGLELGVRIGIHTGPVVVGEMGGGASRETLAVGDTANIAARLQAEARPGTVVLSPATLRLVQGIFVTRDLGARELKGVDEALHVHQAVRPSGMRSRLDVAVATGLTPFIGREQELMLLEDRWAQVQEGRGQAVLVCGEAGIGKSRLVQAYRERLAERAHTWLECRASAYTQDSALYPVLELHRQALGFRADDAHEAQVARLEAGLEVAGFELAQALPLMAAFHALPAPDGYQVPVLSPEAQRQRTLALLCEWLLRLGRQQPVVLLIEDLHWIDPSTVELLGAVLEQIARAQVLLLLTYRPDFEPPWGAHSHATPMLLSRLTRSQLGDLIRKAAGGRDLPDPWVAEIIRRSDGVPLFAEELTRAVLESNPELPEDGVVPELHIPETLQDSLMARLDALGPVKELAQLGAVLGREFSYDLLLKVSPMKEESLQQALAEAVREELFYQRGTPPEATYLFKHALTRDAAYHSLLRATRQRHHRRVAQTLIDRMPEIVDSQPELVAHHLTEAGDTERAIEYWQRAGKRASERMQNSEAIHHLRKGLELLQELPAGRARDERELRLQLAIGPPLMALKGYSVAEVEQAWGRARELCEELGEAPQLHQALFGLGAVYHYTRGQLPIAAEVAHQLEELAERSGEASHLVLGNLALGLPLFDQGHTVEAIRHLERAIELYDPSRDRSLAASYGFDLDVISRSVAARALWQLGRADQGLVRCREAIERARESPYVQSLANAMGYAAIVHHNRRERELVRERAEQAIAISEEQQLAVWRAVGRLLRGWARADAGCAEGIDEIQQGMAQIAPIGLQLGAPYLLGLLAEAQRSLGRRDDALGTLDACFALAAANDNRFWDSELLRLKGELLLEDEARAEEGEGYLRQALELAKARSWRALALRAATSVARVWSDRGRRAEARELLQPIYAGFTEGFDTQDLRDAKALLAELGGSSRA